MPFELKNGKRKKTLILNGRVDISEAMGILNAVKGLRGLDLDIDMGSVSSVDCSVLQLLISVKKALEESDNRLQIKAGSEEFENVMRLAGAVGML